MGMLEDLAAFLDTAGVGVYTPGAGETRNIFVGRMPTEPDAVIALYEYPRGPRDLLGYKKAGLHVEVRGAPRNYATPRALIESVISALHGQLNQTIGSDWYTGIQLLGEPEKIRVEEDTERLVFGCNFRVDKK